MPQRKKPTSIKQKRIEQKRRRAIKRGDEPAPETVVPRKKRPLRPNATDPGALATIASARKLQSSFVKLPSSFLEETKRLASTIPLRRPISRGAALLNKSWTIAINLPVLTCPQRPKWRYDMAKAEVESNEKSVFKAWLDHTDKLTEGWRCSLLAGISDLSESQASELQAEKLPASPTTFERNLEVWRQLWRVSELSHIILILLDSRCPTLHLPPSLSTFFGDHRVILVLTKVDITGPARVNLWQDYIHKQYPLLPVVLVEAYAERQSRESHQGPRQFDPYIPPSFRERLVWAIKEVHERMLEPPEYVKKSEARLKNWVPPVRRDINWDLLLNSSRSSVVEMDTEDTDDELSGDVLEPDNNDRTRKVKHLTVGLVGQPNVGKSSLLNALFGARRVRASKTPGKTKHLQTLFWTPEVCLVDCPGLVMPNYVPLEMQALCGILPISNVSAVASCIHFASNILPLEHILDLVHPGMNANASPVADKRTWRDGMRRGGSDKDKEEPRIWTAMDILTAYADAKGWVTAKAGRPDVHRAGNAILRALAEAKISWGFLPPDTPLDFLEENCREGDGIWIPGRSHLETDSEIESDSDEVTEEDRSGTSDEGGHEEEEVADDGVNEGDTEATFSAVSGRFSALAVDDEND